MRALLLQLNPVAGDLRGNAEKIRGEVIAAGRGSADLVITPELALTGYHPRDLLLFRGFVEKAIRTAGDLARSLEGYPPVLVGTVWRAPAPGGLPLSNAALLLHGGRVLDTFGKNLPAGCTGPEEDRYFEPARAPQVLGIAGTTAGIVIGDEIWRDPGTIRELIRAGARCLINPAASPFATGKHQVRERMLSGIAREHRIPVLTVNLAGGNDDLVFDGRSCLFSAAGELVARAAPFGEDRLLAGVFRDTPGPVHPDDFTPEPEAWHALVLGTRDYLRKTGFGRAIVGLSGGIDSSLVAAVATEALGRENVFGVLLPSPYSSGGSLADAAALGRQLGIRTTTLPIGGIMGSFDAALAGEFAGLLRDTTEENLQARIRGTLLMALSNKSGAILLSTGNRSEIAVGYCTLYGDTNGGLAVIGDVPKTMVYRIARWLNSRGPAPMIPEEVFRKPPSAELRPGQADQDTLPPYDILDGILHHYLDFHESPAEVAARGYDPAVVHRVARMVRDAEFKRRQVPPAIRVSGGAFGAGWRMPVAAGEWDLPP